MHWKTPLYLSVSLILALVGVVFLFAKEGVEIWVALGTSLVAAGLASAAFGVNRYLEEHDERRVRANVESALEKLNAGTDALGSTLFELQGDLEAVKRVATRILREESNRIYNRHPKKELREALERVRTGKRTKVRAMGLSLRQFCTDYLELLVESDSVEVLLIVQDPTSPTFQLVCGQESRDATSMAKEVIGVTEQVLESRETWEEDLRRATSGGREDPSGRRHPPVQIRWFPGFPTITFTSAGQEWFVRFRTLNEASAPPMFFEHHVAEEESSDALETYFLSAWSSAREPSVDDCRNAKKDLRRT